MGKRKGLLCALLAAALLLGGCAPGGTAASAAAGPSGAGASLAPGAALPVAGEEPALLECRHFNRELFLQGLAAPAPYQGEGALVAGIVPHHLLAADMLSGFFALAAQHSYDSVIVIAPSHYPQQCGSFAVTTRLGWNTPFGTVAVDDDAAERLLQNTTLAAEDNAAAMEFDHAISGLLPYIAYYLPGVPVATCLVSVQLPQHRLDALQHEIDLLCEEKRVLVLASADFSHYQSPEKAAECDRYTAEALEAFDYGTISTFSSQNVDSPQSLITFLRTVQRQEADLVRLGHSSSEEKIMLGISNPVFSEGITTYYVYAGFTI